jgi:hypothetical protein
MEEKIEDLIFLGVDCSKEERKKLTKELLNLFSVNYYGESIYNTNGIITSELEHEKTRIVTLKDHCS